MKISLIVVFFACFCHFSMAQIILEGSISSEEQIPLIGATIEIKNGKYGTTSNHEGRFRLLLKESKKEHRIIIRMLGYTTIDTLISSFSEKMQLDITMKLATYEQTTVEVVPDIFQYEKWKILDYNFHSDKILVLFLKGRKRKIGLYNLQGQKLHDIRLDIKYDQIFISCMNNIHLLSKKTCTELTLSKDKIRAVRKYNRSSFDKLIKPCILKVQDELVFKNLSTHNKRAKYFKYTSPKKTILIKEIIDVNGAKVAQSYYNDIIRLYYQAIDNPEKGAIDEGIKKRNKIDAGEWSGDVFDLIESNKMVTAVAYYKNTESKAIEVREFELNDLFFILDLVNKDLLKIDVKKLVTTKWPIVNFDWNKKSQVLKDKQKQQIYIFSNKKELYRMGFKADECILVKHSDITLEGHFPQSLKIHDNQLYYFSYNGVNSNKTSLYKINLN